MMQNKLNPYLQFEGNCQEAFRYYAEVLDTQVEIMLYGDVDTPTPQEFKHLVLYARLPWGNNELTGADCVPGFGDSFQRGNNFALNLSLESLEGAQRIFDRLSRDGRVIAPLVEQFAAHIGILEDKYGLKWIVSYPKQLT